MNYDELAAFRASLPEEERFEYFRFFVARWDIVKARFLIQQTNKPVDALRVAEAARAYEVDRPQSEDSAIVVDEVRAMSDRIDTNIPVILALIETRSRVAPLLIDGLHRLYRAYREGRETIPCYALSPEEERQCRL